MSEAGNKRQGGGEGGPNKKKRQFVAVGGGLEGRVPGRELHGCCRRAGARHPTHYRATAGTGGGGRLDAMHAVMCVFEFTSMGPASPTTKGMSYRGWEHVHTRSIHAPTAGADINGPCDPYGCQGHPGDM